MKGGNIASTASLDVIAYSKDIAESFESPTDLSKVTTEEQLWHAQREAAAGAALSMLPMLMFFGLRT